MSFIIRVLDGQPFEHPIIEENFKQAFPDFDVNNLPEGFAKFEKVDAPRSCGPYQIEYEQYEWVDGIIKEVWYTREMTEEEKAITVEAFTYRALDRLQTFKRIATEQISASKTENAKAVWTAYKDSLDVVTWTDPAQDKIPWPPRIDENGNLLTNENSGSSPNVIG